jgi:hypothetical protein
MNKNGNETLFKILQALTFLPLTPHLLYKILFDLLPMVPQEATSWGKLNDTYTLHFRSLSSIFRSILANLVIPKPLSRSIHPIFFSQYALPAGATWQAPTCLNAGLDSLPAPTTADDD